MDNLSAFGFWKKIQEQHAQQEVIQRSRADVRHGDPGQDHHDEEHTEGHSQKGSDARIADRHDEQDEDIVEGSGDKVRKDDPERTEGGDDDAQCFGIGARISVIADGKIRADDAVGEDIAIDIAVEISAAAFENGFFVVGSLTC